MVSWVVNGKTTTTSGVVDTGTNLDALLALSGGTVEAQTDSTPAPIGTDKFLVEVYTPDKTSGVALLSSSGGVTYQISGFTISIMDSDGNVKKAANAALDQFKQYQRAENITGDKSLTFHVGSEANVAIKVGLGDMRAEALGLKGSDNTKILVTTKESASRPKKTQTRLSTSLKTRSQKPLTNRPQ